MNLNIPNAFRSAKTLITANSPVLLVGTAVIGVVTTAVLAAKGGYKARGILDEAWEEKGEDLTFQEKASLTWLCYAAPAVTGASSIAAVLGVHVIHNKRHAAMAGLYAVTAGKLDDVQDKVEELLGPKKAQALNDALAQESIDSNPPGEHELLALSEGEELCKDEWSGRYFRGSMLTIERAFADANILLAQGTDVTLTDFYENLGIGKNGMSDEFGWQLKDAAVGRVKLEPRFGSAKTPDGRSAITFSFRTEPSPIKNK